MTERGLKNINVFYSTFTNVVIFYTFFTFLTFFIFFWNVFFTSMVDEITSSCNIAAETVVNK